jgi:chitin disaccharide deacetylase
VHALPGVRGPLLRAVAERYGATDAPAVRTPCTRTWRGLKAATINALGACRLGDELRTQGRRTNTDFAGAYDMARPSAFRPIMRSWLATIAPGGLIMVHPGAAEVVEHASSRRAEGAYLSSRAWEEDRSAAAVRLVPF